MVVKNMTVAEEIVYNRKKRNAKALIGSKFEFENNLEMEQEIFERELAGWACNTPDSWTKKNSINVNIDSISGTLKLAENCLNFAKIFLKNYELEEGIFNFNYQRYQFKIISNGLTLFKNRINVETGEIEDVIYFS